MAKQYEKDFKLMIVNLVNSGRSVKEVSLEYDLNDGMVRRWRREQETKSGAFTRKVELTKEELKIKNLEAELKDIRMERDILKKAVSIFSKSDR